MSAEQDFTGYSDEVDTSSKMTQTASTITITAVAGNQDAYLADDSVSASFVDDYAVRGKFTVTATTGSGEKFYIWALCDSMNEIGDLIAANTDLHCLSWEDGKMVLTERNGASSTTSTSSVIGTDGVFSEDTPYWWRVVRDMSVGSNGTLYAYFYSDSQYMEFIEKLTVTLTEDNDFDNLYACSSAGNGSTETISITLEDLIIEDAPYTLEDLRDRARDILNEDTADFWSDAQLTRLINDAEREIAIKAMCIQHIDSLSTSASTRVVAYSGYRCMFLEHLVSTTEGLGLRKILPLNAGRQWEEGSTPQKWYESGSNICIEPILVATSNLNAYVVDYPAQEMSNNPDLPSIPPAYRPLIILYTLAQALKKEKRFSQSAHLRSVFEAELMHTRYDKSEIIPDSHEKIDYGR